MRTLDMIRKWADDRNLIEGATSAAQYQKLLEEVGELGRALIEQGKMQLTTEAIKDGIGDCVVVLTILASQCGMTVEDCIEHAYEQIKDRKDKMVNGIFVKEQ